MVPLGALKSRILQKTAASLGITQIVTSWAITMSGFITYPHSMRDPHAAICLALALLGSASHVIPFWLGKIRTKKRSDRLRIGLCTAQHLFLLITYFTRAESLSMRNNNHSSDRVYRYERALVVFMILTFLWDFFLLWLSFAKEKPRVGLGIFNALSAIVLTIVYITIVLSLKFKLRDCNMNQGEDNQWTFGQYLALFVLVAPVYATLEAWLGMQISRVHTENSG